MKEETIDYSQGEFLCRDNENITINNHLLFFDGRDLRPNPPFR